MHRIARTATWPGRSLVGLAIVAAAGLIGQGVAAQEVQRLYPDKAPGSEQWNLPETVGTSPDGGQVYGNVVDPEFITYLPDGKKANGAAVIVLPGGGLRALFVGREASEMIGRFNAEGIAVFVLKYRVLQVPPLAPAAGPRRLPAGGPPPFPKLDIRNGNANPAPEDRQLATVLDLAVEDARLALRTIRCQASKYGVDPHRIGMIGSSAGGGVAIGAYLRKRHEEGAAFLGSLYGPSLMDVTVAQDAPPLFIATDADHGPVTEGSLALFSLWKAAGRRAEMHFFDVPAFGMPAGLWLDRFMDWMREQKLLETKTSGHK